MTRAEASSPPLPPGWPVLVTGAGGFVGGWVARTLAAAGYRVRGLSRRPPLIEPGDPPIDWMLGDLRRAEVRARAVEGMLGLVHVAGWVSLGADPDGESRAINVEATRDLLARASAAGVERFVYTSTLWTVAAGTAAEPADEDTPWNLDPIQSPYCESKRLAERLVIEASSPAMRTAALCPGLVIGPRDVGPTSTRLFLTMARTPMAILPGGGIPVVDARVVAQAHMRALERAEPGRRYVVAGPYLSYREMATLVASLTGRPRRILSLPNRLECPMTRVASLVAATLPKLQTEASPAAVAGGFLRLHVSGARADAAFSLVHRPPIESLDEALEDHRRSGRAPWLRLLPSEHDRRWTS